MRRQLTRPILVFRVGSISSTLVNCHFGGVSRNSFGSEQSTGFSTRYAWWSGNACFVAFGREQQLQSSFLGLAGLSISPTTSRLYLGVFGLLMFPVLSAAIIGFVLCFVAAPPVDIDGIQNVVMQLPLAWHLGFRGFMGLCFSCILLIGTSRIGPCRACCVNPFGVDSTVLAGVFVQSWLGHVEFLDPTDIPIKAIIFEVSKTRHSIHSISLDSCNRPDTL